MSFDLQNQFNHKIQEIFYNDFPKNIIIAVSGGIDSMALLFLANQFCKNNNIKLTAITIDHKIRQESTNESNIIAKICQKHNINHKILTNNYFIPQSNIEANLREIRYDLLSNFAKENNIKDVFIAHHRQDIAENFLIRLFRGSGIDGLSKMEEITKLKNINLIRPLLDFSKEDLMIYLKDNNISYIEDPSNYDQKFLRNKIRSFLNDFDNKEIINQRIAKASDHILENRKIIENLIVEKSDDIYQFNDLGYFLLKKHNFKNLQQQLVFRYLNLIFNYFNGNFYKSRLDKIQNIYHWIINDTDYKAKTFAGAVIENYNTDNLIIYREKSKIIEQQITQYQFIWDNRFEITIDPKLDLNNLTICTLTAQNFNSLIAMGEFKEYKNIKNPLKKIFYTIPVIKLNDNILFKEEFFKIRSKTPLEKDP
ncbi:tRNA lysidine(34) synthetase TilS, partial [Rickettsiales bacterium]|nr:tRNA lysidine(34) synthetase TilS [Rickettsiales bacterium]MDB2550850.1 tRNA lysidine(34) synthetase TilS [Rickettsiales bacterium]